MDEPQSLSPATPLENKKGRIKELEGLRRMTIYLRRALLRTGSNGFWHVAVLPELLKNEIAQILRDVPKRGAKGRSPLVQVDPGDVLSGATTKRLASGDRRHRPDAS
jgi:hypothetical protein